MEILAQSFTRLVVGTLVGASVVSLIMPQRSWADDAPRQVNPLQDFNSEQNADPFSSRNGDNFSMMDLIRRATANTRSWDSYTSDQNQNLDSAAAQFRARQRQLIQGQQASPSNSVGTSGQSK